MLTLHAPLPHKVGSPCRRDFDVSHYYARPTTLTFRRINFPDGDSCVKRDVTGFDAVTAGGTSAEIDAFILYELRLRQGDNPPECEFCGDPAIACELFDRPVPVCSACGAFPA